MRRSRTVLAHLLDLDSIDVLLGDSDLGTRDYTID